MLIELLIVLGLTGLTLWLAVRLFQKRRSGNTRRPATKSAFDQWVDEQVSNVVAKKTNMEPEELLQTLRGEPDPDAVTAIEAAVRSVELGFERLTHDAEVTVEVSYEDGSSGSVRKRTAWGELPRGVRDEFERTGGSRVFRGWHFPWSEPDA